MTYKEKFAKASPKFNPDESTKKLLRLANWGIRPINLINMYASDYEGAQKYKKVLNTMIDFNKMYLPAGKPSKVFDALGHTASYDEGRQVKRLRYFMLEKDIISTVDEGRGERKLIVTSRGHRIFYEEYPLAKLREKKWDRHWILIMYDIPEHIKDKRVMLRNKLMGMGFGSPQISSLVSPLPLTKKVKKLIKSGKLINYVWISRSKGVYGMSNKEVAMRAWPLYELNDLYKKLYKLVPKIKKRKDLDELKEAWRHYFLAVINKDPHLPNELLPPDWYGEKCKKEFVEFGKKDIFKSIFKKIFS